MKNGIGEIHQEFDFLNGIDENSIADLEQEELQKIISWYFREYYKVFPAHNDKKAYTKIEFYNGIIISLPKWFLEYKGHRLEDNLVKVFPGLEEYSREGKGGLQKKVIKLIYTIFPLVPKASTDIIRELIEGD